MPKLGIQLLDVCLCQVDQQLQVVLQLRHGRLCALIFRLHIQVLQVGDEARLWAPHVQDRLCGQGLCRCRCQHLCRALVLPLHADVLVFLAPGGFLLLGGLLGGLGALRSPLLCRLIVRVLVPHAKAHAHFLGSHLGLHRFGNPCFLTAQTLTRLVAHLLEQLHTDTFGKPLKRPKLRVCGLRGLPLGLLLLLLLLLLPALCSLGFDSCAKSGGQHRFFLLIFFLPLLVGRACGSEAQPTMPTACTQPSTSSGWACGRKAGPHLLILRRLFSTACSAF
mmetsp:Transcript_21595/g.59882  ORF Transcript_21595/g.59882 Transcript_21595/m.59882 type:complete len:278 (+) Transcript_21595:1702-2535(+)